MTARAYVRLVREDGKIKDTRELVVDGLKVAELSSLELIEFIAQATLSLKDHNGEV